MGWVEKCHGQAAPELAVAWAWMLDEAAGYEIDFDEVTVAGILPRSSQHPLAALRVEAIVHQNKHRSTRNVLENERNIPPNSFRRMFGIDQHQVHSDAR